MMDQNLDSQFSIEDNKYEIAKGASKALPTLPSTVLNLPPKANDTKEYAMFLLVLSTMER